MTNNPQLPWTDEQWARVSEVIQEEATRARVAATFLPLYGPLPPDTDFVRRGFIDYPALPPADRREATHRIGIDDATTIKLATLQVKVYVRGAQMADSEMGSVLALFRRAANVLARLEDAVVFNGLAVATGGALAPGGGVAGLPPIWEIRGGEASDGLWLPSPPVVVSLPPSGPQPPSLGSRLVTAVSEAIGRLEGDGHFGPFTVVLGQDFFLAVQTPDSSLVLPQDRIIPFLGGGSLLRSSTLPAEGGVVIGLGGAPVELVIAKDLSLQFLQVTNEPRFLFRVYEKLRLRIKEPAAVATLIP